MAKVILFAAFFCLAGGIAYLAFSDMAAPTKAVEKPIPAERFFQK